MATILFIKTDDSVTFHVEKVPGAQRKLRIVTESIPGRDTKVRGAKLGLSKTTAATIRTINNLYLVERLNVNNTRATFRKKYSPKNYLTKM